MFALCMRNTGEHYDGYNFIIIILIPKVYADLNLYVHLSCFSFLLSQAV